MPHFANPCPCCGQYNHCPIGYCEACNVGWVPHAEAPAEMKQQERVPSPLQALPSHLAQRVLQFACPTGLGRFACVDKKSQQLVARGPKQGQPSFLWNQLFKNTFKVVEEVPDPKLAYRARLSQKWRYFELIDGKLYIWGSNRHGWLGRGEEPNQNFLTYERRIIVKSPSFPLIRQVIVTDEEIFAREVSIFAIGIDGSLWGWGGNLYGLLGVGHENPVYTPTKIPNLPKFNHITVKYNSVFIIDVNGKLWVCGNNINGQLGIGRQHYHPATFECVANLPPITQIVAAPYRNVFAVDISGGVWVWGNKDNTFRYGDYRIRGIYAPKRLERLRSRKIVRLINESNEELMSMFIKIIAVDSEGLRWILRGIEKDEE